MYRLGKRNSRRIGILVIGIAIIFLFALETQDLPYRESDPVQEVIEVIELSTLEQAKLDIWNTCVENGLEDEYLKILAICIVETGWFKSFAYENGFNYCGITVGGKVQMYSSKERGLECLATTMSYYKGMPVERMAKKYCPPNWRQWAKTVNEIMKGLENEFSE